MAEQSVKVFAGSGRMNAIMMRSKFRKFEGKNLNVMENNLVLPVQRETGIESAEIALVEAARTNPAHFGALYQRYYNQVYRYLRTRVEHEEDAADLTQVVFLKAMDALPKYHARGIPFAAWLFRIARHTVVDTYRRHKSTVSWDLLPEVTESPREQHPEVQMLHQEQLIQLRELLSHLDPKKRELLALRFAGGLSSSEIAAVLGKSHASVKKQITRILQSLKEHYHNV